MREKLIELMKEAEGKIIDEANGMSTEELDERLFDGDGYGFYADHFIANGVTVQEWILFDAVKPKDGQSVLGVTTEGEIEVYQFDANWETCLCQFGGNVKTFNITHWMPLPEPPKGE